MHRAYTCLAGVALAALAALPPAAHGGTLTPVFAIPGFNDGAEAYSNLTEFGGKYYGTTQYGGPGQVQSGGPQSYLIGHGVAYSIDPKTGKCAIVRYFGGACDGSGPGNLTLFQGKLYGTMTLVGMNNTNVLITLDPVSGTDKVIASFPQGSYGHNLTPFSGKLFGIGPNSIFSFDPAVGVIKTEHQFQCGANDGCSPGSLLVHGSYMFGVASGGGAFGSGTLFRFEPSTGTVRTEHSFNATQGNSDLNADLVAVGDILYGTSFVGGPNNAGTIYSFDLTTGKEAIVYSFPGTSGNGVANGLLAYNGLL